MNYLIDTNVIAEVRKGERCHANVAHWWAQVGDDELFLSVLVIGEIRKGIERARPRDPAKAGGLDRWLTTVMTAFAGRILPVDQAVAEAWGRLNAPDPMPTIDSLLAATAQVYELTLVTRNLADMPSHGVSLLDPFAFGSL